MGCMLLSHFFVNIFTREIEFKLAVQTRAEFPFEVNSAHRNGYKKLAIA
jgi:hypothetical protein